MDPKNPIQALRDEIKKTLLYFVESDIQIFGHVKQSTVEAFETQKVTFPEEFKPFIK